MVQITHTCNGVHKDSRVGTVRAKNRDVLGHEIQEILPSKSTDHLYTVVEVRRVSSAKQ